MSTISPQEQQWYKELVTPFQPMGRLLIGADLRGTQCNRFGQGNLRLVGYGDSSGGYAFTPKNQDAAIAPSLGSSNLSNIANSLPRITEVQDMAGKWIDTITLHALDEFIEQTEPQSFIANVLRIFSGGQKGFRGDGTGNRNIRNTYTLLAEIPIPALTRADIPRSFNVKVGAYIPPAQNVYLGLAIEQPYTCSFEMWDLQANTQIGSGYSSSIGGSSTVPSGNDLNESIANPPVDTQFVLPIRFASATWIRGTAYNSSPTPPPPTPSSPILGTSGSSKPSDDSSPSQPPSSPPSSPSSPAKPPSPAVPPPSEGGCTPIQNCSWHQVTSAQSAQVDANLNNASALCPAGTVPRGIVDFETSGSFVLCCTPATYPPQNLGCSSLTKYSCSGGVCVEDAFGTYNSLIECQSALLPPQFSGGQCTKGYSLTFKQTYADGTTRYYFFNGASGSPTPPTLSQQQTAFLATGPVNSYSLSGAGLGGFGTVDVVINGISSGLYFLNVIISTAVTSTTLHSIVTQDGSPDNCGDAPGRCP